ncbi:uncharacterized protein LOC129976217 [Argiope bruennichi]|uniref:Uncharacterized protein n=1 Tax=Argiope bruennichi TaxID=94029 RepID=A0A8T0EQ21_ARGBR|nr:uncharacterized protein LOC129976217 [Argiope bruennichi]KAF8777578.1 hypothetical protein HNY73_014422 [Argiope bruennichi]
MAAQNTSPSSRNSDSSEIHDIPIVPPRPIARKEYKEVVPDISVVSDIADNGSKQNFQRDDPRPHTRSKYFQLQSELKSDMLAKSNLLLSTPDNLLHRNINHTSYEQQLEIDSGVAKRIKDITKRTNTILDHNTILPVKIYFNPACPSCITNCTGLTNKGHNGIQHVLPKNSSSVLLAVDSEQSDKDLGCKSEDGDIISNKTCCKHIESNVTANSSHNCIIYNHTQLPCASNSKEPEMLQVMDIPDCCCSKVQNSKLKKSLPKCERHTSSDSGLGESKKSEETSEKEMVDKNAIKNRNILCPTCWKKTTCTCNFSSKKYNANSLKQSDESVQITEKFFGSTNLHASSDELSSIWEYLKQQDEKIDLIHKKVSNFLSQHESCCLAHPEEENMPKATESDIPYILNILEVHSDKIRELQDQINTLKSNEQKSFANNNKVDESILNQAQTINCADVETCNEDIHVPCSHNVICHEQRQKVTQTSTSTMTSFAIENNDKLVYHKQLTVVADVKREKKDSSSLQKEHDSPTTVNANSHKRKSHKLKCSPRLKGKTNASSNSSSDAPDYNDNQVLKTSYKSERKSKRASTGNKVPDERHVNDSTMKDNNVKERKNSPALKTDALKSHSRSSKQKQKNNTSAKVVDMAILRDSGSKKMTRQISTSSSSTNSDYDSPKQRQIEFDSEQDESTTKSKYGLSSKYLSIATKTYLDKFQLYLDKNNRTESS